MNVLMQFLLWTSNLTTKKWAKLLGFPFYDGYRGKNPLRK